MSDVAAIPRVGQIGTGFTAIVDEPDPNTPGSFIVVDLTDADAANCWIEFRRPDNTTFRKLATVLGDPTLGKLRYVDSVGIFDMPDTWWFRAVAGFDDGTEFPGSWYEQPVGI